MTADRSREKLNLHRSQNNVLQYGSSCLSAINDASLLNTTVAVDPIPPVVENNFAGRPISRAHLPYSLSLSASLR